MLSCFAMPVEAHHSANCPDGIMTEIINDKCEATGSMDVSDCGSDASPQKSSCNKTAYQRRPKPPFSYIALIAMAIRDSQTGKLTLAEINEYLMKKFPFFRGEYTGWRNSVRHNLSLNECFQKVLRDPNRPWGKDNFWMLNESSDYTFADGVFRRRRKRLHKKCRSGSSKKGNSVEEGIYRNNNELKSGLARARHSSFLIDDLLDQNPLKPPPDDTPRHNRSSRRPDSPKTDPHCPSPENKLQSSNRPLNGPFFHPFSLWPPGAPSPYLPRPLPTANSSGPFFPLPCSPYLLFPPAAVQILSNHSSDISQQWAIAQMQQLQQANFHNAERMYNLLGK